MRPPPDPASTSYDVTIQEHGAGKQYIGLQIFKTSAVCSFMFLLYLWIEVKVEELSIYFELMSDKLSTVLNLNLNQRREVH